MSLKITLIFFIAFFSTIGDRRRKRLIQFIKNCGFVEVENNSEDEKNFIDYILRLSYKEAKDYYYREC